MLPPSYVFYKLLWDIAWRDVMVRGLRRGRDRANTSRQLPHV